ncbi:MAG: hypothetical protein KAY16_01710 [Spirochaetes bacterium]|nr:hypothetical protein [Spirochaetota bacterium]
MNAASLWYLNTFDMFRKYALTPLLRKSSEGTDAVAPYGSCEDIDRMSSAARWQRHNKYRT